MSRKKYYEKLRKWEAEGYNVLELRERWFPAQKVGGEGPKVKVLRFTLVFPWMHRISTIARLGPYDPATEHLIEEQPRFSSPSAQE
jgi:hypothetical protein